MTEQYYITNEFLGNEGKIVKKEEIINALLNGWSSWYKDYYLDIFNDPYNYINNYTGKIQSGLEDIFDRKEPLSIEEWAEKIFNLACDPVEPYEDNKFVDDDNNVYNEDGNFLFNVENDNI